MKSLAKRWRAATLLAMGFIGAVLIAWQLTGEKDFAPLRAVLSAIPLLLPLRGLIGGARYTYRWASLCVLPYFVFALTEAFANPNARGFATALLAGSLAWFFALIGFLRASYLSTSDAA